jgi:hypothetical protein
VLCAVLVLVLPWRARGEVYKWVDKNGDAHYTTDPTEIPRHLRRQLPPPEVSPEQAELALIPPPREGRSSERAATEAASTAGASPGLGPVVAPSAAAALLRAIPPPRVRSSGDDLGAIPAPRQQDGASDELGAIPPPPEVYSRGDDLEAIPPPRRDGAEPRSRIDLELSDPVARPAAAAATAAALAPRDAPEPPLPPVARAPLTAPPAAQVSGAGAAATPAPPAPDTSVAPPETPAAGLAESSHFVTARPELSEPPAVGAAPPELRQPLAARPDTSDEERELQTRIDADRELLKQLTLDPRGGEAILSDPQIREIAKRLPRLQAELQALRSGHER